jgi:hypothetical protein
MRGILPLFHLSVLLMVVSGCSIDPKALQAPSDVSPRSGRSFPGTGRETILLGEISGSRL